MNIRQANIQRYKDIIEDFSRTANAELKDSEEMPEKLKKLSGIFHDAVQQKTAMLQQAGANVDLLNVAIAVANDVSLQSGEKFLVREAYGRPAWRMDTEEDFHKWLQDYHEKSITVAGVAVWLLEHGK